MVICTSNIELRSLAPHWLHHNLLAATIPRTPRSSCPQGLAEVFASIGHPPAVPNFVASRFRTNHKIIEIKQSQALVATSFSTSSCRESSKFKLEQLHSNLRPHGVKGLFVLISIVSLIRRARAPHKKLRRPFLSAFTLPTPFSKSSTLTAES